MAEARSDPGRRLPRAQRREQILAATTTTFTRNGFTATGLDDIAAQAGITRVILYRHFDCKTYLYQAALDQFLRRPVRPRGRAGERGSPTPASTGSSRPQPPTERVPAAVRARPKAGVQAAADRFHAEVTAVAHRQISQIVADQAWAQWAAQMAPAIAIEAIISGLDAGQPDPDLAADRIRHVIAGVITAATAESSLDCLPPTA